MKSPKIATWPHVDTPTTDVARAGRLATLALGLAAYVAPQVASADPACPPTTAADAQAHVDSLPEDQVEIFTETFRKAVCPPDEAKPDEPEPKEPKTGEKPVVDAMEANYDDQEPMQPRMAEGPQEAASTAKVVIKYGTGQSLAIKTNPSDNLGDRVLRSLEIPELRLRANFLKGFNPPANTVNGVRTAGGTVGINIPIDVTPKDAKGESNAYVWGDLGYAAVDGNSTFGNLENPGDSPHGIGGGVGAGLRHYFGKSRLFGVLTEVGMAAYHKPNFVFRLGIGLNIRDKVMIEILGQAGGLTTDRMTAGTVAQPGFALNAPAGLGATGGVSIPLGKKEGK